MCAMNMSRRSVDSRRTLQSKLRPPGAMPPCSNTAWTRTTLFEQMVNNWLKDVTLNDLHDEGRVADVHRELIGVPTEVRWPGVGVDRSKHVEPSTSATCRINTDTWFKRDRPWHLRRRIYDVVLVVVAGQHRVVGFHVYLRNSDTIRVHAHLRNVCVLSTQTLKSFSSPYWSRNDITVAASAKDVHRWWVECTFNCIAAWFFNLP